MPGGPKREREQAEARQAAAAALAAIPTQATATVDGVTYILHQANRGDSTTGYRGVSRDHNNKDHFKARYKSKAVGTLDAGAFATAEDAAVQYSKWVEEHGALANGNEAATSAYRAELAAREEGGEMGELAQQVRTSKSRARSAAASPDLHLCIPLLICTSASLPCVLAGVSGTLGGAQGTARGGQRRPCRLGRSTGEDAGGG